MDQSVNILAAYRKYCSAESPPGQLILPETIKLLPLCLHSLVRHDVISVDTNIPCDQRAYLRAIIANKPLLATQILLYPIFGEARLLVIFLLRPGPARQVCRHIPQISDLPSRMIHELSSMQPLENRLGKQARCRYERLNPTQQYLITNGLNLFFWLGKDTPDEYVQSVFQQQNINMVSSEHCRIHYEDVENPDVRHLQDSISLIREKYSFGHFMKLLDLVGF